MDSLAVWCQSTLCCCCFGTQRENGLLLRTLREEHGTAWDPDTHSHSHAQERKDSSVSASARASEFHGIMSLSEEETRSHSQSHPASKSHSNSHSKSQSRDRQNEGSHNSSDNTIANTLANLARGASGSGQGESNPGSRSFNQSMGRSNGRGREEDAQVSDGWRFFNSPNPDHFSYSANAYSASLSNGAVLGKLMDLGEGEEGEEGEGGGERGDDVGFEHEEEEEEGEEEVVFNALTRNLLPGQPTSDLSGSRGSHSRQGSRQSSAAVMAAVAVPTPLSPSRITASDSAPTPASTLSLSSPAFTQPVTETEDMVEVEMGEVGAGGGEKKKNKKKKNKK
ncbi:hypothetical protein B484DRAFT_454884 [Ochromonadaceae sp. CCMP2298]|nr:hypothetical protein B484DRAFT_454884 [Ochromonadaceae sp. CCMP2298]